ncbi:hypothetical protein EVJ58_g7898 [Rhodofomes roseus]|uniref:SYO1-like TPR repeats domain-containing protein n=1 Tax=Rhodofomes roseus TaxID=34475 RepID=A0A4Y9Y1P2_9APHY|nr:hypothetical protein EVJ58_g7898 [Rhodofomes roseus]
MGKSQKKRQMRRHNPMRVPDSHLPKGLEAASSSSSRKDAILPILQKMESVDPAERKWACVAVSNLIQNDPSTRRLLQGKNVVGALINRLSDSEEEVIVEATGSLRNLCIDGGFDICAEMYNKNILTPLKTFIPKISKTLSEYLENPKTAPENAQQLVYEFADNVITILWCLSETSNKAMNAINQISLVPFLMSFLASRDKLPISTVTSAAQCLYVLTDENPPAVEEVRSNAPYSACILSIVQSREGLPQANGKNKEVEYDRSLALQVLCCGILRNISPVPPPSVAATVAVDRDIVMPTLEPVLSLISLPEASQDAQEQIAKEDAIPALEKLSLKHTPKSDHKTPSELELERLEHKLRTVQLALEVLTGVCATLPDPDFDVRDTDGEGADEDDEEAHEDEDMDDEPDVDMAPDDVSGMKARSGSNATIFQTLVAPLLTLIQPTSLSFSPLDGLSPHPPTTSALSAIHVSALECLNNIFLSLRSAQVDALRADPDSGRRVWDSAWQALGAVGTDVDKPGQERRRAMWEIGVGVLWGVAEVWKGLLAPDETHVKVLIQLCDATTDEGVKMRIGQGRFLDALVASVEGVRKAVRGIDRKKERELRVRGEEVRDNLVAFIEYRRGLGV